MIFLVRKHPARRCDMFRQLSERLFRPLAKIAKKQELFMRDLFIFGTVKMRINPLRRDPVCQAAFRKFPKSVRIEPETVHPRIDF